jgi:hypothetical protein
MSVAPANTFSLVISIRSLCLKLSRTHLPDEPVFYQLAKIDAGSHVFTGTVIRMHLLHTQFSQRHVSQTCTTGDAAISLTDSGTIEHYEASTAFWFRENAGHSKIFAAPFRYTFGGCIGRCACFGSVARLGNPLQYWKINGKCE